ncbi:MAG: hypothetical protein HFH48_03055 [Lachnospiraceae bacterium]|nr:hypothetical protein [Lachnospiraceae bacterium]
MDTKHIHCMLEDVAKYGKEMVSCMVGDGNVNLQDLGEIIDIVKDLACAEKDALIAKEMRKANEEDEAEEKHFLKILKDEYKDEFKKMKEEYGEDEGEKRFYDNYRYKSSGRFAPKGKGSYMPRGGRRGYEEPPYYHMNPEMYKEHDPEWYRDMDRNMGKMYYTDGGNSGGQSGSSMSDGNMGGNAGGSTRGYEDGFNDGNRRGYEDGYRDGESRGRSQGGRRDGREGRSGQSRRSYMETKEMNKGNSPQEKQEKMKELEKYMGELGSDITEMISDASNEEKTMLKSKLQTLVQKIQ